MTRVRAVVPSTPADSAPLEVTRTRRRSGGRVRVRAIDTDAAKAAPVPEVVLSLSREMYIANKAKNAQEGIRLKAEKTLTARLAELRDDEKAYTFNFATKVDKKTVQLDVAMVEGSTTSINLDLLRTIIDDDDVLMTIISATKAKVLAQCGAEVVARIFKTKGNGVFKAKVTVTK